MSWLMDLRRGRLSQTQSKKLEAMEVVDLEGNDKNELGREEK